MSGWVKTSVDWFEDPQIEELGADAAMLHLSALAYCARQLTNGDLPSRALRRLYPVPDMDGVVRRLVEAGKWKPVQEGFLIVEWREHILSADEVKRMREQSRITSERYRRHKAGDHSMCDYCSAIKKRDGVTDGVSAGVSDAPPNLSSPIRPEGKKEDRGGEVEKGGSSSSDGSAPLAATSSPTPPTEPWVPDLPGPPPGVVPTVNGVPLWETASSSRKA